MNLWKMRSLGKNKFIRGIAKYLFSIYFRDGRIITIGNGPLKGYKWLCNKEHQFWMPLGLYEIETATWIEKQLSKTDDGVFIDMGANAGYFTLLGSKYVGSHGKVIAFEPIPKNVNIILAHLDANDINNTIVETKIVSNTNGTLDFTIEENNANSHISDIDISHAAMSTAEVIKIKTVRLDDYVKEKKIQPKVIKIDVEGAELDVLNGALETLRKYKPFCIVSTHSKQLHDNCKKLFEENGYTVENLENFEHELCCYPK